MNRLPQIALLLIALILAACGEDKRSNRSGLTYPAKPIKVVVPFSPGGGSDTFARAIQTAIDEDHLLAERLVIVNRPGAGGTIGSRAVKDAHPDGYTVLFLHDAIVTARYAGQATYGADAFEAVAATGEIGAVIAVSESSPITSLGELMTAAIEQPETVSFAADLGAPSHFWALLLEKASPEGAARFRFVQSGGGALRFGDLKGGHVSASAFSVAELLQFQSEGLRALAYLGEQRSPVLPDLPTAREQGFDVVTGNLQSWWAPKGTPAKRIAVFAEALEKALQNEGLRQRMAEWQIDPRFLDGAELRKEIQIRDASISRVAAREMPALPNIPRWTLMFTLGVVLWIVVQWYRERRKAMASNTAESPEPPASTGRLIPLSTLMMIGIIAVTIGLWSLGRIGIASVAVFLVLGAGTQLRDKVGTIHLMILAATGGMLAIGTSWLFRAVLGVDL